MKPQQLLRESIVNNLRKEIFELQEFYRMLDKPAFIRIEGGLGRKFFTSANIKSLKKADQVAIDPITQIKWLDAPEEFKGELIAIFSRLSPGVCLIIHDSDSNQTENRYVDWFVVSV